MIPDFQERGVVERTIIMQDGAPRHIANPVKSLLHETFEDRVISRQFDNEWPPRSPDLTPADYWLWGYLKSRVYRNKPANLHALKESIRQEVRSISPELLQVSVWNVLTRLELLQATNGGHIEQLM